MKKGFAITLALLAALGSACAAQDQAARDQEYKDPAKLAGLVAQIPYILVDVRTPEEYATGFIPTAVNIPVADIALEPPTQDKNALIIVYCASGRRSAMAAKTLVDMGYTRVVDFGGISRWKGELVKAEKK
jgi:phage shock protein E